ncbi:MAG TPA: thymidine phosphorylase [Polyangiaceae bacterium]
MRSDSPVELIVKKRDGRELVPAEIQRLVAGAAAGTISDYQLAAWLMAAFLRGLSERETWALTDAMLHSGKVLTHRGVTRPKVDKHSTGGVGDKVSICLAPLVAACGVAVPMICGRGLGHTGGTLDKLEAIPGFRTELSTRRFERIVRDVGVAIVGQSDDLAPADRKLYALRDVTGTVESVPLIVASILSKKLAEGIDALVFDVKVGCGAFMKTRTEANALAKALVRVGSRAGKRVVALLSAMHAPLGRAVGNALEIREAVEVLRGGGPADTKALTLRLGAEMLLAAKVAGDRREAAAKLERALERGDAFECFCRMVRAQGGDVRVVEAPERLPRAPVRVVVPSARGGYVSACDAFELGLAAVALGAGRSRADDRVDPRVGIELCKKPGDRVERGEPLAFLHAAKRPGLEPLLERVRDAFRVGGRALGKTELVLGRVTR